MGINVCTYQGKPTARDLAQATLIWTPPVDVLSPERTPLLFGIDEYDDTVFNQQQARLQLPSEIAYLRLHLHQPEQQAMLDELEHLVGFVSAAAHRHLWFIGD